ncbi:MAG: hypothetical protein B6241_06475 [Spirochaetaceae bacterium 4572_59]|nr:MAG: hypothetical protein B6241_06475 [Spirochaetaceae bacterium 4572_59]
MKRPFWKKYKFTVFVLILIFSVLTLNHYKHSVTLTQPSYRELTDPFMDDRQKEIREAGCLFSLSLGKIERICQYDYSPDKLQGIFWKEKEFNKRLVLTFDDGPNMSLMDWENGQSSVTAAILDTLSSRGLTGVFFINGKNLESGSAGEEKDLRDLLNRMILEGNMIGNHSYHHYNLARGIFSDGIEDYQDIKAEFDTTQAALDRILGYHYPLILIRPPYAEPGRTDVLDHVLKDNGQYLISLQFDSYDYAYTEEGYWQPDRLLSHVKKLILPAQGGVLLMHDHEISVSLLKNILDDQDIRSCIEIVDMSEILFEKYQNQSNK